MKRLLLVFLLMTTSTLMASGFSLSTPTKFTLRTSNASFKLETTLLETNGFLKRFNPAGVKVVERIIVGNHFNYHAIKKVLGFSNDVELIGTMNVEQVTTGCSTKETGYLLTAEFSESPQNVTDFIENFTMLFCSSEVSETSLSVKVKSTLNYKGEKFGSIVQKIVSNVLEDQADALVAAIKEEALSAER